MIEKIPKPQEKYKEGFDWLQKYKERNEELEPDWQSIVLEAIGTIVCTVIVVGAFVAVAARWISHNG